MIAAISAAVLAYIKTQESAKELAASAVGEVPQAVSISLWSSSGRQAMMEMRRLLQFRLTRR
jgi:hypothetical protein